MNRESGIPSSTGGSNHRPDHRSASVLILVLIVIAMVSLAAYSFTDGMLTEAHATAAHLRRVRSRHIAHSGLEYTAALLSERRTPLSLYSAPQLLHGVRVGTQSAEDGTGIIHIIATPDVAHSGIAPRFGVDDESAKLNLNALPLALEHQHQARRMLLGLPGMTVRIADAILDWMDEDDRPRPFGAEHRSGGAFAQTYQPRNGRFHSPHELLSVRGVTPELLFGSQAETDQQDDSFSLSASRGNRFSMSDETTAGWWPLLTVNSAESNLTPGGQPRIDLNQPSLAKLYDAIEEEYGIQAANFIVAYRLAGPLREESDRRIEDEIDPQLAAELREREAEARARRQLGLVDDVPRVEIPPAERSRGGFDLTAPAVHRFDSLYDLFGRSVRIRQGIRDLVLDSPWAGDAAGIARMLPELSEVLTTTSQRRIRGRINVNLAPRPVLIGLPGMTEPLADAIVAAQRSVSGSMRNDDPRRMRSTAWLLDEGLTDLPTMRRLGPFITTRGDVFRVNSLGTVPPSRVAAHLTAMVDVTGSRPVIRILDESQQRLSASLGREMDE